MPVSATSSTAVVSTRRNPTVMPPLKVNLSALDSRLRTIFSQLSRSTQTGSSSAGGAP